MVARKMVPKRADGIDRRIGVCPNVDLGRWTTLSAIAERTCLVRPLEWVTVPHTSKFVSRCRRSHVGGIKQDFVRNFLGCVTREDSGLLTLFHKRPNRHFVR